MSPPEDLSKLKMAPLETAEEVARRFKREKRLVHAQREDELSGSPRMLRAGSVPYLNAVPLTRGLEDRICFLPPSQLAQKLREKDLDAALVSVTEVLLTDLYHVLDGISVSSLGEVKSVFLAHKQPLNAIKEIFCDTASLTSVQLLKVLLGEQGLHPAFLPLASYEEAVHLENVLLIGDPAICFLQGNNQHQIWDLGAAWYEMTNLPFVYAVWALRKEADTSELKPQLKAARDFGLETLDSIVQNRSEFDYEFRHDYLTWHIHYHLGDDEKRGIQMFIELLRKYHEGPVFSPKFVV